MATDLLEGKKIILIEDNEFLANVIVAKLQKVGAEIKVYENGLEGLAAIRLYKPDLVLLDIMLPVMNGYEVLEIMSNENLVDVYPVMIVSNSGQPVELQRVLKLGAKDYLIKADFTPEEVLEKARAILQASSAAHKNTTETEVTTPAASEAELTEPAEATIDAASVSINDIDKKEPVKVFVIEDDPMLRNMLSVKFSTQGLSYMFISDGAQALELTKQYDPDIIILDLMLPGKDGFEVLQDLKQDSDTKRVPVIIFTNKSEPTDVEKVKELGAQSCHVKAMTDLNELVSEIRDTVPR